MTTCEKHGTQLKMLLTSTYCDRCDEEAKYASSGKDAVAEEIADDVYFDSAFARCSRQLRELKLEKLYRYDGWTGPVWHGPGSVDLSAMTPTVRSQFLSRYPEALQDSKEKSDAM